MDTRDDGKRREFYLDDPRKKFVHLLMDASLQGAVNWPYVADRIIALKLMLDKATTDAFFERCDDAAARNKLIPEFTRLVKSLAVKTTDEKQRLRLVRKLLGYALWRHGFPELRSDLIVWATDLYDGELPHEVGSLVTNIQARIMRSKEHSRALQNMH